MKVVVVSCELWIVFIIVLLMMFSVICVILFSIMGQFSFKVCLIFCYMFEKLCGKGIVLLDLLLVFDDIGIFDVIFFMFGGLLFVEKSSLNMKCF